MFGTFAEMSLNVKDFVEKSVEYRVEHLEVNMVAMTPNRFRMALRRMYKAQLSLARSHANLILYKTKAKYGVTGVTSTNRAQIRQCMLGRADAGEHIGI